MKAFQLKNSNQQHLVAIGMNGELRQYFSNSSSHISSMVFENVLRDIANNVLTDDEFLSLPLLSVRTTKTGNKIYD